MYYSLIVGAKNMPGPDISIGANLEAGELAAIIDLFITVRPDPVSVRDSWE